MLRSQAGHSHIPECGFGWEPEPGTGVSGGAGSGGGGAACDRGGSGIELATIPELTEELTGGADGRRPCWRRERVGGGVAAFVSTGRSGSGGAAADREWGKRGW